ncbi:MAG: phosphoglucomutase/phosphomannomutase family protein [SAR202 cluster bacterium]|nr:phosphoglucomutase/phosphomannomutase family protein [SAR202 cluster bacterium]|tara:strand:- start:4854 stop:6275 length:1422 start_codon:yes stop_codon:yes gene_type:complete
MPIQFGTDGWRGIIADDFTFENVRYCAQGVSDYILAQNLANKGLIIGYDTRFSSEEFADTVAEVSAGNGIKTLLCDRPVPTPVISYNVLFRGTGGACVITASHNPPQWNGFKFKPEYAGSASPEIVDALERNVLSSERRKYYKHVRWEQAMSQNIGSLIDPSLPYLQHVSTLVDIDAIRNSGLRIVADPMYGAGAGYFTTLLEGGALNIVEIHGARNPIFPGMLQPEPVAKNLVELSDIVVREGYQAGLALDADADRFGLIDEKGNYINPLQVLALLALYMLEVRGDKGPLVKSLTSSNMIYRLAEIFDVPVFETPVGFKYIGPTMIEKNALLAGEESGGFGFRRHIPERDGILSGLFILDMMVKMDKTPSELIEYLYSKVGPHYYRRDDILYDPIIEESIKEKLNDITLDSIAGVNIKRIDQFDGTKFALEDGSWLAIRFSGTEPLLRIYSEAKNEDLVDKLISEARHFVGV